MKIKGSELKELPSMPTPSSKAEIPFQIAATKDTGLSCFPLAVSSSFSLEISNWGRQNFSSPYLVLRCLVLIPGKCTGEVGGSGTKVLLCSMVSGSDPTAPSWTCGVLAHSW